MTRRKTELRIGKTNLPVSKIIPVSEKVECRSKVEDHNFGVVLNCGDADVIIRSGFNINAALFSLACIVCSGFQRRNHLHLRCCVIFQTTKKSDFGFNNNIFFDSTRYFGMLCMPPLEHVSRDNCRCSCVIATRETEKFLKFG